MKKIIISLLCLVMMLAVFTACSNGDEEEDKGVTIPVYMSTEIANFDPAYANLDDATTRVFGLIYEGLFKYDSNGKVVKSHAKSVKVLDKPEDNYYAIEIKLKYSCWSDATRVQAGDYIFAWKRILEPEFRGEGASLLFDIKNARAVNSGDMSIDDLGVTDESMDTLRIEFEGPTDYDKFYEYLASPLLVPLREAAIDKTEKDWSSTPSILVCNGPFCVRTYTPGETLVLERNIYYRRDVEKDSVKKYVTPYRISINFDDSAKKNLEAYEAGKLVFNSEIPLDKRAEYASSAEITDTMSIMTYVFNTKKAPFDNADVRKALSLAVDRNEIVNILTFAKPAGGMIADGVFNTEYARKAKTFRDVGGDLISASANLDEAKAILKKANYTEKNITITVRNNEADLAVADYIKGVWKKLGFNVTVEKLNVRKYKDAKEYDLVQDRHYDAYASGEFQVICVDYLMVSTDAFANLAQFAKAFSGGSMDMNVTDGNYQLGTHVSGYYNPEYDALIEAAFAKKDAAERAEILHDAEELLMSDMPIMPLVQLQQATLTTKDIKDISKTYYGYYEFTEANLKHANKYPGNVGYVEEED